MRIAFIADVHANLPALEAVIADAREHRATHLLCLGDVIGYGPQPVETLARIREVASGVILGNHDAAAVGLIDLQCFNPFAKETAERATLALDDEAKDYLKSLPHLLEVKNIACAHSCFDEPSSYQYLETKEDAARSLAAMPNFSLLVVGHTHIPCLFEQEKAHGPIRKLPPQDFQMRPGHRYVVNPGSVGFPRTDALTADYLIYDTLMRRLTFRSVAYDLRPYRLALVRNGYNPLNYWFLSPSARKRQTELALRNPVKPTQTVGSQNSPFKPVKANSTPFMIFWICVAAFLAMLLASILLQTRITAPPEKPRISSLATSANILAPLAHWTLPEGVSAPNAEMPNRIRLTPDDANPRHITLLSPLTTLPKRCEKLGFSFAFSAPGKDKENFSVCAEFIDQQGNRKRDRAHVYKRPGARIFTIRVPKDAMALQMQFNIVVKHPIDLQNPELKVIHE